MTDGIATGWHHALWALGYLLGAAAPLVILAVYAALMVLAARGVPHRVRVLRLRRQARRSGRTRR